MVTSLSPSRNKTETEMNKHKEEFEHKETLDDQTVLS